MATVNLGSIKFKWKGTYNGATAYTVDDVVEYNGSSYICILASTGNLPTNATYFEQMSSAGTNGTDGTDLTTTLTTQGDIVYRDASGLARLGAGTSGQVLQTGGTGANPSWGTVSSDFVKLYHTTTESNPGGSTAEYSGYFTDDYDHYRVIIMHVSSSGGGALELRLGNSSIDTSSNYRWANNFFSQNTSGATQGDGMAQSGLVNSIRIGWNGDGSNKNMLMFDILNARNTSVYSHVMSHSSFWDNAYYGVATGSGYWASTSAVERFAIGFTGTIQINNIAIYGYKT